MKNNKKGFVLTLALLMLVVMSVMGITLVALLSNDIRQNCLNVSYTDSKSFFQSFLKEISHQSVKFCRQAILIQHQLVLPMKRGVVFYKAPEENAAPRYVLSLPRPIGRAI